MGATTPYCTFRNSAGQAYTLNMYYAGGDAAGYQVPVSASAVATTASNVSFVLPAGVWSIDHITGPATGKIRLWANGSPGPIALDMASVIAAVAAGKTYGRFRGGSAFNYMFVVESAMAA